MPSNRLILCCSLLLLPSIFPSIRDFSKESALHIRWPKYWSFSFNISPSKEHSGLISFRMDWLDLLAVQGTLKSLLQYHSSKASILQCSVFFTVQFSHPYMTCCIMLYHGRGRGECPVCWMASSIPGLYRPDARSKPTILTKSISRLGQISPGGGVGCGCSVAPY